MLSLARSRYALPVQFVFVTTNAFGVLVGTIYNANTPDLYPNNSHHKLGWIATWVVCAQIVTGFLGRVSGALRSRAGMFGGADEHQSFIPVSREAMAEHHRQNGPPFSRPYRLSHDSGQGTEPKTESLRGHSLSGSGADSPPIPLHEPLKDNDEFDDEDLEADLPALPRDPVAHSWVKKLAGLISTRFWEFFVVGYNLVDRTILPLGFIALCTGIIAFGRFFVGS